MAVFNVSDVAQLFGLRKEEHLAFNGKFCRVRSTEPTVIQIFNDDHVTVLKECKSNVLNMIRCTRCSTCNRIHVETAPCSNCVTAQESPLKRQKVEFNVDEIGCYHASFKDGLIAAEQYERALQHLCKGSSSAWHLVYRAGFIDAPKFMVECEKLVKSGEINLLTFTKDMLRTLKLDEGEEAECIMMFVDEVCELFPDKTVLFCTVLRALIENGETETKALNYVFPCIGKELRGVLKIYQSLKTVLSDASMDMYNAKLFDDILDKMTGNLEEVLTECGEFKKEGLISESQYAAMVNKWFSMMQGSNRYALFMSKKFLKEAHQDYIIAHMSTIPSPAESKELYADGLLNEKNYDNILSKWVEKVEGPPVLVLKQGKEMVAQGLIKESHYQEMVKKCLPHCF
jgi:hypothetical protein